MALPKDPYMLLSAVNMKLRDEFSSLDELIASLDLDRESLLSTLAAIDYLYDSAANQFKPASD